ncbi:MAG: hypothetical protein A3G59_00645 [Candidatus Taylorbacteria bacterium RIFCSPLOWO2_12_FULL_47_20]|uniref:DNA-directed DNA polymerase n=1 Tax=Candidatus Taylorbacteria bacterium RIFCSPLOWO2_12_FULL_47_20 TaxID=1802335 RepID=A0A1G2P765_9BACT|nr:MAG: hypothetical protein A3G59_00645 [Candidatus Taylorbacteria bacterium RIFCSPLOWO2_12_FULL_47_20]
MIIFRPFLGKGLGLFVFYLRGLYQKISTLILDCMFYFFHGSDFDKVHAKAEDILNALKKKRPEAEIINLDADSWSEGDWERLCRSQGLFDRKYIVVAKGLGERGEIREFVESRVVDLKSSENAFLLIDRFLDEGYAKALTVGAEKAFAFESKTVIRPRFNVFDLADAFGKKDKKGLWVLFQKALKAGVESEQIHGALFWQVKNMALAMKCKDAEEAGVKDFPFMKAKKYVQNFSGGEIKKQASWLTSIYHEARSGGPELEIGLEKWILSI